MVKKEPSYFDTIEALQEGSKEAFESLEAITDRYPYFQNAWLHRAKWASMHQPEQAEEWMQQTACRTFDRSLLFAWNQTTIEPTPEKQKTKRKSPSKKATIKPAPKASRAKKGEQKRSTAPPQMTFTDWLQFVQTKNQSENSSDRFALIDAFLAQQPKIKPPSKTAKKQKDLSEASWTSTDELMTETLAKIFVKQKKYDKAIKAYEILRLKYPEKNSFFANQIKAIKELQ